MKLCKKICIIYGLLALSFQFVIAATATEELFFTQLQAIKAQMPKAAEKYIEEKKRREKANSDAIASRQGGNPVEAYKIDRGEVLLRKYSGKIGEREVSFFVQIYKKNITHGVIALPNEPMLPFMMTKDKKVKIGFDYPYLETNIDLDLNQNLELQVGIKKQKIATFSPQCPATKVCSYVKDYINIGFDSIYDLEFTASFLYFPDLQKVVFMGEREYVYETYETYTISEDVKYTISEDVKSYQEAREKVHSLGGKGNINFTFLFANDTYISFVYRDTYPDRTATSQDMPYYALLDIKSKIILDISSYLYLVDTNKKLPKTFRKYSTFFNEEYFPWDTFYYDGFYYRRDDPIIPIQELKPYLKAGMYDYLIGKSPTLPKAIIKEMIEIQKSRDEGL